jgi:hypothetical protein
MGNYLFENLHRKNVEVSNSIMKIKSEQKAGGDKRFWTRFCGWNRRLFHCRLFDLLILQLLDWICIWVTPRFSWNGRVYGYKVVVEQTLPHMASAEKENEAALNDAFDSIEFARCPHFALIGRVVSRDAEIIEVSKLGN